MAEGCLMTPETDRKRALCGRDFLRIVLSPHWGTGYQEGNEEGALVDRVVAAFASGSCDAAGLQEIATKMVGDWQLVIEIAKSDLVDVVVDFLFNNGSRDRPQNAAPILNFLDAVLKDLLPFAEVSEECGKLARKVWGNRALVISVLTFMDPQYPLVSLPAMKILLSFLNRSPATFRHDGLFVLAQRNFATVCKIAEESARRGREEHVLYATRITSLLSCSRLIYSDRMVLTGPLFEAVTGGGGKDALCTHLFEALAYCSTFDNLAYAKEVYTLSIETIGNLCTAHTQSASKGTLSEEGQSTRLLYHLLDVLYAAAPRYTRNYCAKTTTPPTYSTPGSPNVDIAKPSSILTHPLAFTSTPASRHTPASSSSSTVFKPCLDRFNAYEEDTGDDCMLRSAWRDTVNCDNADEVQIPRFPVWHTDVNSTTYKILSETFRRNLLMHKDLDGTGPNWLSPQLSGRKKKREMTRPQYATNSLLPLLGPKDFNDIAFSAATLLVEYLRNADLIPLAADTRPKMNKPVPCAKPVPMLEKLLTPELHALSDYTIVAQDKEIGVYKCILAAYVPYFASLFEHEPTRTHTYFEEPAEIAELWVRYVHTFDDCLINTMEKASGLLRIADRLCQDNLRRDCEIYLFNALDRDNLYTTFALAVQCNALSLVDACATFALRQLPEKLLHNSTGIWWLRGHSMLVDPSAEPVVPGIPFLNLTLMRAHELVRIFFRKAIENAVPDGIRTDAPGLRAIETGLQELPTARFRPELPPLPSLVGRSTYVPDAS